MTVLDSFAQVFLVICVGGRENEDRKWRGRKKERERRVCKKFVNEFYC
jgi:hypothetical protein